ncbi:MAG: ABC transporter permease [Pseudorhodoplanes sp.]
MLGQSDRLLVIFGAPLRAFVYFLLALPAVIVVISSFNENQFMNFPPPGFTLRWYRGMWDSVPLMGALGTSMRLALLATFLSLLLGAPAAFALTRYEFRGNKTLQLILLSPMVLPAVVLSLGLLQFFALIGMARSNAGLVVGHVLITLPYVVRTLTASFLLLDRTLEQAAANLRAPPLTVARRITLPLILPGLLSATLFSFVTSLGNVTVSMFLSYSASVTLPIQILQHMEMNFDPIIAAISTIVILLTVALIAAVEWLVGVDRIV